MMNRKNRWACVLTGILFVLFTLPVRTQMITDSKGTEILNVLNADEGIDDCHQ